MLHMRARTQPSNYLVDVAAGTKKVSTDMPINVNYDLRPPEKVMQTAVVGMKGSLSYRLNLDGFPGFGKFVLYSQNTLISAMLSQYQRKCSRKYRLYEAGYNNLSLPFGPLLNAMEIHKYLEKNDGSLDGYISPVNLTLPFSILPSRDYLSSTSHQIGHKKVVTHACQFHGHGQCNSDARPQIIKLFIPSFIKVLTMYEENFSVHMAEIAYVPGLAAPCLARICPDCSFRMTKLTGLVELWLDGNSLTGPIPDFTGCTALEIIYSGNINLHEEPEEGGTWVLLSACQLELLFSNNYNSVLLLMQKGKKRPLNKTSQVIKHTLSVLEQLRDSCLCKRSCSLFHILEIEDATKIFEKKIGSGGFGVVYYGKMKDGREIAVKVLTSNSYQGKREFSNEVSLLSRIHHRNLVQFLGFCQEVGKSMLVYEFMHNGTLKEHLYGPLKQGRSINWIRRLEIAEDAAKGIEYLHTGCVPAVIHRDLKTSNILLDKNMRAKVADFGLSKLAVDGASHVSSVVRGTVGYLDPEYYISQQLTDKSDVYSFGVVLLELMSGQEAISNESFGINCRNIVQWAKLHIERGDIQGIIDPSLCGEYDIQSMWKVAEKALMCVQPHGHMRPSMSELLKDIRDAILIEREVTPAREAVSDEMYRNSGHSSANLGGTENYRALQESTSRPAAR
uniref:Protein kinase domain-containing protein n=1 Tax=Salix viminalis TaxID=40686 RepID=A0A6N2K2G0_SALVM